MTTSGEPTGERPATRPEITQAGGTPGAAGTGAESAPAARPAGAADERAAPAPRRTWLLAATALALLVADLVSKAIVVHTLTGRSVRLLGGLVYVTEARNTGAAFSFAQGATVLFTLVAAVVVVVIVRSAARLRSTPWAVCLGLILGGASGNLVDRLFRAPGPLRGAVVDWISVLDPYGHFFPIFNLADSGIVCGGILAVLLATLGYEVDGRRHPDSPAGRRRGARRRSGPARRSAEPVRPAGLDHPRRAQEETGR